MMMTSFPVSFQLTVIHPTMPDSVKEMDLEVSKSDVHNTAKDSHRQVILIISSREKASAFWLNYSFTRES